MHILKCYAHCYHSPRQQQSKVVAKTTTTTKIRTKVVITIVINLAANYFDVIVEAQTVLTSPSLSSSFFSSSSLNESLPLLSIFSLESNSAKNQRKQKISAFNSRMSNGKGLPTRLAPIQQSQPHEQQQSSPQTTTTSLVVVNNNTNHQFFLEEFGEDFDVASLSNLCLGGGNGNHHQQQPQQQQQQHHHHSLSSQTIATSSSQMQHSADNDNSSIMTKTIISNSSTSTVGSSAPAQQSIENHHHHHNHHQHHHHHHHHQQHHHHPQQQQQQQPLHNQQQEDHNNNLNNINLLNQFFTVSGGNQIIGMDSNSSILSDLIKIEDEYHLSHLQQQHDNSSNVNSVTTSSTASSSSTPQQPSAHHSSMVMVRSRQPQSAPSPAMLMNHLDLSSIRSPTSSSTTPSSTTPTTPSMSSSSSAATTVQQQQQHHNHQQLLLTGANASASSNIRGGSGFDPNEIYYADSNADDSCQSLASVDSSTIVHNAKSLVLQSSTTVLMPGSGGNGGGSGLTTEETKLMNQVSKKFRFKDFIDSKHTDDHQESAIQQQQQQQQQQQSSLDQNQSSQQLELTAATLLEQNPFAYRPSPELLNENIYSSRNVANCYSYAWRRWSKTDAPSVKKSVGTVQVPHTMPRIDEDGRKFQYILGAPTSAGTRIGSMTMTYLNQGQSYEIRLKKLKKLPQEPNLKTSVKIGFVEKRLQYRENEELSNWVVAHNNVRMVDIDFSMSYGVFDVDLHSAYNHSMTFVWNPGREASIFVKINCISTEFTSKRHGGERGTPFRLIVDTFAVDGTKLDSACCLIKVFKSKGAERKHKTDRDRVAKHQDSENYYQPSYDCTLLTTYKEEEATAADPNQPQQQDDQQRGDDLTNRSTESPSGSEISLPNTPISPNFNNLLEHQHHHPQQQQQPTMFAANIDHVGPLSLISSPSPSSQRKHELNSFQPQQQQQQNQHASAQQQSHNTRHHHLHHQQQQQSLLQSSSSSGCESTTSNIIARISSPSATAIMSPPQQSSSSTSASQLPQSTSQHDCEPDLRTQQHCATMMMHSIRSPPMLRKDTSMTSGGGGIATSQSSLLPTTMSASGCSSAALPSDAGAIDTYEWLKRNRFFRLAEQLCDYTSEDLRRLSRDDLIQLCDFKDGIRLYNLIHMPSVDATKLTIFITMDGNEHDALYFKQLTVEEFREKLSECLSNNLDQYIRNDNLNDNNQDQEPPTTTEQQQQQDGSGGGGGGVMGCNVKLRNVHITGPNGIKVKLTNNVIKNMKNESIYSCIMSKANDEYDVVIKLANS